MSIFYCETCYRCELRNQLEMAKNAIKVLSADTVCANKRESALEMIQYYYSIFDISVRGRPMLSCNGTTFH